MSNDNQDNGGSRGDDECPKDKKQIFLSNNFFNYRSSKLNSRDQESNQDPQQRSIPRTNANNSSSQRSSIRDHFLTPLTDTSIRKDPKTTPTESSIPSVFTDAERSQTLDSFSKIFMQQIRKAISSGKLSRAWYGGDNGGSWLTTDYSKIGTRSDDLQKVDSKDYVAERTMIQPHLTPFVWGVTCSAFTLFSLRFGKWYQTRKLGHTIIPKSNNVINREIMTKSKDASAMQDLRSNIPNNYSTYSSNNPSSPKEASGSMFENLMSLPVDMALSMLIGISTSIYLTQPQTLMRDLSESPLLEGKSVLAEELCGPFTEEMERVNGMLHAYSMDPDDVHKEVVSFREMWRDENLGEFESLRAVRNFVGNCRQRGS